MQIAVRPLLPTNRQNICEQLWKLTVANCLTHFPSQPLFSFFASDILSDTLLSFVIFALSAFCPALLRGALRLCSVFTCGLALPHERSANANVPGDKHTMTPLFSSRLS